MEKKVTLNIEQVEERQEAAAAPVSVKVEAESISIC